MLGGTRIERGGESEVLPARRVRSVLAALALEPGSTVTADRLVDLVWGDAPPRGAHGTLHSYISGLRRALEPDLAPRAMPSVLITSDAGYRLALARPDVDATDFTDRVRALHRRVAPLVSQLSGGPAPDWPDRPTAEAWLEELESALGGWRGTAYADLGDHPDAVAARNGVDELRLTAEEDRALVMLALGDHAGVVAATEQGSARNPFRERTWALHALALTRSGRQADALAALRRVRAALADELGLDPGAELRGLEAAVLRQDEAILAVLPPGASPAPDAPDRIPSGPATAARWDLVGRTRERTRLTGLADDAEAGRPAYAIVVGEPGMGKSRLVEQLREEAAARGFVAVTGRCSQDDGAPPLWPWTDVLDALAGPAAQPVDLAALRAALHRDEADDYAEQAFAAAQQLALTVRRRSATAPVLVVFDDAQWADSATIRAVGHLVDTAVPGERLAVVVTRRALPAPAGGLADLEVTLARHGARRIELGGLDCQETAELVESVAPGVATGELIERWRAASAGNPFFLVELARLAAESGGRGAHGGWSGEVPASVQAVIRRRLENLPEPTRAALVVAAALGREFSPAVLASVVGLDPLTADERLDPARDAGIVRDLAHGDVAFEHALTRDTVLSTVHPAQLSRTHARIAYALTRPGVPMVADQLAFELARHWLAAGPIHASQAWPAAVDAARLARAEFANEEAVDLLAAAAEAQRLDPAASRDARFEVLVALAEVAAYAGRWERVVPSAVEAVSLAGAAADPRRVARAAAELTRHSVWLPQAYEVVDDDLIEDLRSALGALDPDDSADRVRLVLALATQLYYAPGRQAEIGALVDEGMASARRLADPALTRWAAHTATISLWRPRFAETRQSLAMEALAAARLAADADGEALALTTAAGNALEVGDLAGYERWSAAAAALAARRRLRYLQLVLGFVELNLAALRRAAETDRLLAELQSLAARSTTPVAADVVASGAGVTVGLWRAEALEQAVDGLLAAYGDAAEPMVLDSLCIGLVRCGRLDDLRSMLAGGPLAPVPDYWATAMDVAYRAELAAALGDPAAAAEVAPALRSMSGRMGVSGVSALAGPVDGYLALAEAVLGNAEAARSAAGRAVAQAQEWGMAAYLDWLHRWRAALRI
ncbi:hypothetical protein GCM10022236_51460 [Microlunatus ginsengisoli]|uniref:OmpR/PhoB-type domain-containing protein n=1 Tax=Microlunatus ginsengisoli TaxID=363863 RepID=A0ABP7AWZ8_9ACTN